VVLAPVRRTGAGLDTALAVIPTKELTVRARTALAVLAALIGLLAPAGCTATSRSSSCVNGTCTIGLSGEQTVEIEIGSFERDLRVGPIRPDAVTVSARGEAADIGVGGSAQVGGLLVRVDSISGRDVGLQVQRS
jgi:hypothetical protein